ncbi:hypothetical protein BGK67_25060 [Streptomyces subrutilus]|uniref:Uncharacterized protein n=1 Tax=Streptomyces subrutilus TaxID=36818 RepID=A0A1E5PX40_9ACTN|nr:hypothetical protein BGK67_25060 [Streptomyces subrutilus]
MAPDFQRMFAVRWVAANGSSVKHRFFAREHAAADFFERLTDYGKTAGVWTASVTWTQILGGTA